MDSGTGVGSGVVALSDEQIKKYAQKFLPMVQPDFLCRVPASVRASGPQWVPAGVGSCAGSGVGAVRAA